MIYESFSEEQTKQIAFELAERAKKGDIYCLSGDLGTGKTAFTKGFAQGLKIKEDITSPTFTIINEYIGKLPLYHFDVYRISSLEEMDDTGYEEYFFGEGVCIIEWAEMIKEFIPDNAFWITIEKDFSKEDDYRKIKIERGEKNETFSN